MQKVPASEKEMDAPTTEELRAAYLVIQKAQARLTADRAKVREQILAAEPTWGPCHQCGHTWRSNNIRRRLGKPPRRCPKCLSHFWYDPEYIPRPQVSTAVEKAAGTEISRGQGQGIQTSEDTVPATPAPVPAPAAPAAAPFEMPPPPKFEFAPPESVRFAEDDTLEMMKKARDDE